METSVDLLDMKPTVSSDLHLDPHTAIPIRMADFSETIPARALWLHVYFIFSAQFLNAFDARICSPQTVTIFILNSLLDLISHFLPSCGGLLHFARAAPQYFNTTSDKHTPNIVVQKIVD